MTFLRCEVCRALHVIERCRCRGCGRHVCDECLAPHIVACRAENQRVAAEESAL